MGEAKRRGNYQERVEKAVERAQTTMKTRAAQSQIEMQEHLQRLQARRIQMESQMGPLDKLHVQQSQMLRDAADKLKRMEGVQIVSETNEAVVVTIASPESLGTVIEGEAVTVPEPTITTSSPTSEIDSDELKSEFNNLTVAAQGGFRVDEMAVIVANPAPEVAPVIDNSHFDNLSPIVHESKS